MTTFLPAWGEELSGHTLKGRKAKNVRGGRTRAPKQQGRPGLTGPAAIERIKRIVKRAPEVVVKISGGGRNMRHVKAHMDYISRNGEVAVENERGEIYEGREDIRALRDEWKHGGIGMPEHGEKRREALNIVFSMPAGTHRPSVTTAVRELARENFQGHQYAFAEHDDEDHTHVHLVVKIAGFDGYRLQHRKADLAHWRDSFAEHLRAQGIEANATTRKARGVVQRPVRQAIKQMEQDGRTSYRAEQQRQDARQEAKSGKPRANPAERNIARQRQRVQRVYAEIARTLVAQGDVESRELAVGIVGMVKSMPTVQTRHQAMVEQFKQVEQAGQAGQGRAPSLTPAKASDPRPPASPPKGQDRD